MTKKTELYVANEIIKGCVIDRPATNGKGENGYLAFGSYYVSKKLVLIVKFADKTYCYIDGDKCDVIDLRKLKVSHELIIFDDNDVKSSDTVIGITNIIPVTQFIKTNDLNMIKAYIEEYNKIIDDNYFSIDKYNYKSVKEKLNRNKHIKKLAKKKTLSK